MMFQPRSFRNNFGIPPGKLPEMHRKSNPRQPRRRRGPTALANGNLVLDLERQRYYFPLMRMQEIFIRLDDQIVLELATDGGIPPPSLNGILLGGLRGNLEIEIERQRRSIERRPQVRGSRRQP